MRLRRLLARSLLVILLATLGGLAVLDRVRVEQVLSSLENQRRYDCILFSGAALRPVSPTMPANEQCIVAAAAAAVDNAGCRRDPIRPDLDTSSAALDLCLALAADRAGGGP